MELTKVYKQTPIGVIPADWQLRTMKDICWVNQGLQIPIDKRLTQPIGNSPVYITIQYLNEGKLVEYINDYNSSVFCSKDDILMTRTGNTGMVISNVEGVFHNNFFKINYDKKKIDKEYLICYLKSPRTHKEILTKAGTSTIPDLNHKDFYSIQIPVPTLIEQSIIASALNDSDDYISSLEKLIEKKLQIKQGAMQELLRPKDGWEIKTLGEFNFDISDGNYSSKYPNSSEFKEIGIPFIRANNIKKMSIIDNEMRFISPELHSELKKGHLKKNDILLTTRGEIGQIALVPDSHIGSNINAQLVRINTLEKIDTRFLAYFLTKNETQDEFMNAQTGSALKQLPINKLKEIKICYPSKSDQIHISQILFDIDSDIFQLEFKLGKAKSIKQGMMQNLLTGKIRLI